MGIKGVKTVVADAGPFIHLNEIGYISLLRIFETIHIPKAIWKETVEEGRVLEKDIFDLGNIKQYNLFQKSVEQFVWKENLKKLHTGECECLYLCQQINASNLLTDDFAVRKIAKCQKLVPVGSLGIIVLAYRLKNISLSNAEHAITNLYDTSSLFVTRTLIEIAIEQLHIFSN